MIPVARCLLPALVLLAALRAGADAPFLAQWDMPGAVAGQFQYPHSLAVTSDGIVYVADRSNDRVQQLTAEGVFMRQFGVSGAGSGQISGAGGVAVDGQGRRLTIAVLSAGRFTCHSFRATTATNLLDQGVPLEDVQFLLGHSDACTTKLYDRRTRAVTRNMVERITI